MNKHKIVSVASEFLPVLVFFATYKLADIMYATVAIMVATVLCTCVNYVYNRSVSPLSILTAAIIIIFGLITVISGDATFIKLKPTILYLTFAAILSIGIMRDKGYIKHIFGAMTLHDRAWITLSKRFALFFIFLAVSNECARIFLSEAAWVNFKVFGVPIISTAFVLAQLPFLIKHKA